MSSEPALRVTVEEEPGRIRVVAAGELDLATVDEFKAVLGDALRRGPVRLDLGPLVFIDSTGVRALHDVLRDVHAGGRQLAVAPAMRSPVLRLLDMTGMTELIPFEGPPRPEDPA